MFRVISGTLGNTQPKSLGSVTGRVCARARVHVHTGTYAGMSVSTVTYAGMYFLFIVL